MAHMPKAVCLTCDREMAPDKSGVTVTSLSHLGPYYVAQADRWRCELCEQTILLGFGQRPIAEQYEGQRFQNARERSEHEFVFRNERYRTDSLPVVHQAQEVLERAIRELEGRLEQLEWKLEYARTAEKKLVQEVLDAKPSL